MNGVERSAVKIPERILLVLALLGRPLTARTGRLVRVRSRRERPRTGSRAAADYAAVIASVGIDKAIRIVQAALTPMAVKGRDGVRPHPALLG